MKKVLEIIGKIAGWLLGIILILVGLVLMTSYFGAGCLVVFTGLLMLPPIVSRIPEFKGKKGVLVIARIFTFIMAIAVTPNDGQSGTTTVQKQTNTATDLSASVASPEETAVEANKNSGEDVKENFDKKELAEWIKTAIPKGEIAKKDREKWKTVSEDEFFPVWQSVVLPVVESYNDDYGRVVSYMGHAEKFYEEFCGTSINKAFAIKRDVDELDGLLKENDTIKKKYDGNLEKAAGSYGTATFYISQRLGQGYVDALLEDASYWVAYDVEYILGISVPGDTYRIIRANNLDPFTNSGDYKIAYYDTGTTKGIRDSRGFEEKVPVYQLIENPSEFESDINKYYSNINLCADKYGKIKEGLGGEQYVSQNNTTQYNNTGGGTYDDSYTKYGGGYTQKYVGDFYQSDESGSSYISMYSSREGDEIGNIEIECEWLGSYKGTIYDYGTPNEYVVRSTSYGTDMYLEFHYDGSTPYFKLKEEPPKTAINAGEWSVIGIFYMTDPWEYH